jgi:hypothetical protein
MFPHNCKSDLSLCSMIDISYDRKHYQILIFRMGCRSLVCLRCILRFFCFGLCCDMWVGLMFDLIDGGGGWWVE